MMLILIPVSVILVLIGSIMTLIWNRTSLKEQLRAERTETSRVRAQHMAAKNALKAAEQKSSQFYTGLHYAIATADKAIDAAKMVEVHGAEMRRFFGMVLGPELETGRHAVPAPPLIPAPLPSPVLAQMPAQPPSPAPQAEPRYLPDDLDPEQDEPPRYEHPYPADQHSGYHHAQQPGATGPYVPGAVSVSNATMHYVNEREQ